MEGGGGGGGGGEGWGYADATVMTRSIIIDQGGSIQFFRANISQV